MTKHRRRRGDEEPEYREGGPGWGGRGARWVVGLFVVCGLFSGTLSEAFRVPCGCTHFFLDLGDVGSGDLEASHLTLSSPRC